jgi:glycosyltransferase involved in cell wall biosynthesis
MIVSVIISTYNDKNTLLHAINSVLNQTYKDFELILINDGSTDCSLNIIKEYLEKDNRIILINKENSGLTKSLNIGLKKAKGKYIARIDADDIWKLTKLEKQIKFLEKNQNYGLIGTAYDEIDEYGNIIYKKQRTLLLLNDKDIKKNIVKFNPFFHSSVVFRKEILSNIGFYNESFKYTQDYEFWIRIISSYKVINLDEILASRRYSENMISIKKEKEQKIYAIKAKLLAIQLLNKSIFDYRYLINDIFIYILPQFIVSFIRKIK